MAWISASDITYTAAIGGVLYRNVADPVVCNGTSLINLARDDRDGQLAVSLRLVEEDLSPIATIEHNEVEMHSDDYGLLHSPSRVSVLHKKSGRLWFDLIKKPADSEIELSLACILFCVSGYPILLHPDRTKFGVANDNRPPNIAFMTLTTDRLSKASAVRLEHGSLYVLGIALENFRVGFDIVTRKKGPADGEKQ